MRKAARDNRSNQLNRNNDVFWRSRGRKERPDDWEEALEDAEEAMAEAEDEAEDDDDDE